MRVLLVDDSRAVLDAGRRQMQAAGYEVIVHARGFGALNVAQAERPDVVLVDVTSPLLQGGQLCQALKEDPTTRHIRVLLHSPLEEDVLTQRVWEYGADGYLSKQWDWERRIAALGEESLPAAG